MPKIVSAVAVASALAGAGSLAAHHSLRMFEISQPIWIAGSVASYEAVNPHVKIVLDVKDTNGAVQHWTVEGPILARLARMNLAPSFLEVGDAVEICGFAFKPDVIAKGRPSATPPLPQPFLHGHVIVMPDGHMQPWGPYGKLENCVRPRDTPERWLDFVNTVPMGREYWCRSHTLTQAASVAPKALLDEVDRRMNEKCQ